MMQNVSPSMVRIAYGGYCCVALMLGALTVVLTATEGLALEAYAVESTDHEFTGTRGAAGGHQSLLSHAVTKFSMHDSTTHFFCFTLLALSLALMATHTLRSLHMRASLVKFDKGWGAKGNLRRQPAPRPMDAQQNAEAQDRAELRLGTRQIDVDLWHPDGSRNKFMTQSGTPGDPTEAAGAPRSPEPESDVMGYGSAQIIRFDGREFQASAPLASARETSSDMPLLDALTGLPNRRAIKAHVERAIAHAERTDGVLGVAIFDLDRFRDVNAIFGDDVGDKLLLRLAKVLKSVVDTETIMGRIGGDEFVFLIKETGDERRVQQLMVRIFSALENDVIVDDVNCRLSASIGVSMFPKDGQSHRDLMQAAGVALCHAKNKGRGQASYYFDDMEQRSEESLQLEYELRRGIDQGELLMFYQPQIDMNTGSYIGAEALLRWQHPQKGLLLPGGFVPLALDIGLTTAIDHFVLQQVLQQMEDWAHQDFLPHRISINMSSATLLAPDFTSLLKALAGRHGVDLARLEIEVLESSIFPRVGTSLEVLQELRDLGVTLAIDDFGTGYSSLSLLRDLPFDRIKIDRSFVANIPFDTKDDGIVAGLVSMAQSLGIGVIAEGVEDSTQHERLIAMGCTEAQGYLFGRPMSAQDFAQAWLRPMPMNSVVFKHAPDKPLEHST